MKITRKLNSNTTSDWQIIKKSGNFGKYKVIKGSLDLPEGYEFIKGSDSKPDADEYCKRNNDSIRL